MSEVMLLDELMALLRTEVQRLDGVRGPHPQGWDQLLHLARDVTTAYYRERPRGRR